MLWSQFYKHIWSPWLSCTLLYLHVKRLMLLIFNMSAFELYQSYQCRYTTTKISTAFTRKLNRMTKLLMMRLFLRGNFFSGWKHFSLANILLYWKIHVCPARYFSLAFGKVLATKKLSNRKNLTTRKYIRTLWSPVRTRYKKLFVEKIPVFCLLND
jgi:hypothetical protein